jgi:gliding motility-associated-like protein
MRFFRATLYTILALTILVGTVHAQGDVEIIGKSTTPVTCYGFSDGTITVNVSGGSGLYNYLLLRETSLVESAGPISDQSYTFTTLEAFGPYFIFVIDEASTEGDSTYDVDAAFITGPDPIQIGTEVATDITCFNFNNGTITVTATGEYGNHYFELAGPVTATKTVGDFTDLPEGDYTVTVTDQEGCPSTDVTSVLTITNPPALTLSVNSVNDAGCFDEESGSIAITPSGGTPGGSGTGYTYSWTGPDFSSTSEDLVNIGAGDYFVSVYDANACDVNDGPITVNEPPEIIMSVDSISDVTCNGDSDGAIYVTVSGGVPGYTFEWSGPGGPIGSSEDISGLSEGNYQLTVTDVTGCVQTMQVLTVNEPAPLTATVTVNDISCFGLLDGTVDLSVNGGTAPYLFSWTGPNGFTATTEDISGLGAGDYSVNIIDSNGCPLELPGVATIIEPAEILVTASGSDISCNGQTDGSIVIAVTGGTGSYQYNWTGPPGFNSTDKDIFGLAAGTYNLRVEDTNGCPVDYPGLDTITEPDPITATLDQAQDPLCNGGSDGFIRINVSGGTLPYTFNWKNSSGTTVSTDQDPTGLPAGNYWGSITDANGCSYTSPHYITLDDPPAVISGYTVGDVTCFGDSTGSISISSSGGTGPYTYSIEGDIDSTYQSGATFSLLGAGTYTVWTRDNNLCVITGEVPISEPDSMIIASETVSGSILCYGDSTLQISIGTVTGGSGPYTYSINGGLDFYPSSDFTGLPAGNYQTVVRDAEGCLQNGELHQITQPSPLTVANLQVSDVTTCSDNTDGIILIESAGGTGTITYTLNGSISNNSGSFTDLSQGIYLLNLEDESGCALDTTAEVLAPDRIVIDSIEITDVTGCFGNSDGSIEVYASGGTGQLRFSIDGSNFNASGKFNGLAAGDYKVIVRDSQGCTIDSTVSVIQPGAIAIISLEPSQVTCSGAADGTISVVATGGTGPLEYTLMPDGTVSPDGSFTGLGPDIYTVLVADSAGCPPIASEPIFITEPTPLVVDSINATDITCFDAADGSIIVYVSGGVTPYEYSIDNQASWTTDSLFTGLEPGSYEIFIRDSNLCVTNAGPVILDEPPALTLSITTTDITTCSYDSTGIIEALGAGGTGSLFYSLDGVTFQDSGTFVDLIAGPYTVTLRDETGCFITQDDSIEAPEPVTAVITKTDAISGNLGSITISGTAGGVPPYEYTIGGPSGPFTEDTVYTDLAIGTYHVIIRDQNGCPYEEMVEILDVPPLDVNVLVTDVSCFGEMDGSIEMVPQNAAGIVEYSIDSGLNFVTEPLFENLPGDSTYMLIARDEQGKIFTGSATISIPTQIVLSSSITPAECNAFSETGAISISVNGGSGSYTYLWSDGSTEEDRSNIVAGTHVLTTTDSMGCVRIDSFYVGNLITVLVDAGEDTTICSGQSIQLNGQGSHIPSWDPSPFISDPTVNNPLATNITEETIFVLTMTEETSPYGCFNKDSIHVSLFPVLGIEATRDTVVLSGASIQLEVSGGPFSAYRWEPSLWLDNSSIPDPIATPEDPVRYWVFATNEYGCEEVDSVFIDVIYDLKVYNVFSPNGDGVNDYFEIDHAEIFPEMRVEIYSRWGDLLYSTKGYDSGSRWDGTTRGTEAPVGTYYYIIIPFSGARPITGNVTIIR